LFGKRNTEKEVGSGAEARKLGTGRKKRGKRERQETKRGKKKERKKGKTTKRREEQKIQIFKIERAKGGRTSRLRSLPHMRRPLPPGGDIPIALSSSSSSAEEVHALARPLAAAGGEESGSTPSSSSSSSSDEHTSDVELSSSDSNDVPPRRTASSSSSSGDSTESSRSNESSFSDEKKPARGDKRKRRGAPASQQRSLDRQGRSQRDVALPKMPWFAGAVYFSSDDMPMSATVEVGAGADDDDVDTGPGVEDGSLPELAAPSGWKIAFTVFDARTQELRVDLVTNVKQVLAKKDAKPAFQTVLTVSCRSQGIVTALTTDEASSGARPPSEPPHRFFFGIDVVGRRHWFCVPRAAERSDWTSRLSGALPRTEPSAKSAQDPDFSSALMQDLLALGDDDDDGDDNSGDSDGHASSHTSSQTGVGGGSLVSSLAISLKQSISAPEKDAKSRAAARTARRKRHDEAQRRRQANKKGASGAAAASAGGTRRKLRDPENVLNLSVIDDVKSDSDSDAWSDFDSNLMSSGSSSGGDAELAELANVSLSAPVANALREHSASPDDTVKFHKLVLEAIRWLFETPETLAASVAMSTTAHTRSDASSGGESDEGERTLQTIQLGEDPFTYLPDEALSNIWSYLQPADIGQLAMVCQRFHSMSYDLPIWASLFKSEGWQRPGYYTAPTRSRSFYVKQYGSFRRREGERQMQAAEQARQQKKQRHKKRTAHVVQCLGLNRCVEWLAVLGTIYLSIIAPLVLDGDLAATAGLLTPLWIMIFCAVWVPCVYNISASWYDDDFETEHDPEDNACGPIFFFLGYVMPLEASSHWWRKRVLISYLTLTFGSFVTMTAINVSLAVDSSDPLIPWVVAVSSPMILGLFGLCWIFLTVGYDGFFDDEQRWDRLMICLLIAAVQVFFMFVGLRMDDHIDWDWELVFIPLWVFHGLWVCLPSFLSCVKIYENCTGGYWVDDYTRWGDESVALCAIAAGALVLIHAPMLAFELMVVEQLNGDDSRNWGVVFVPIYILEGFAVCGCCGLACAFLFN
jgi:Transmembrane Fragile-X-F protein/F-box-like